MHMLGVGVLAGMLVAVFAPGWIRALSFAAAVLFSGLLVSVPVHAHRHVSFHLTVPPLLIALGGVLFGVWAWHHSRLRGLEQLAAAEVRNRWTLVRGISRWGW